MSADSESRGNCIVGYLLLKYVFHPYISMGSFRQIVRSTLNNKDRIKIASCHTPESYLLSEAKMVLENFYTLQEGMLVGRRVPPLSIKVCQFRFIHLGEEIKESCQENKTNAIGRVPSRKERSGV